MKDQRLVAEVFEQGGTLARVIEAYEPRGEQSRMAHRIMETFDRGGVLIAEAPTGIGKSLAYLVPAAVWARRHGPVLVSSYTRTLQDQIVSNDAPLLRRLVHPDLKLAVLKGRSNYLCRRRWDLFREEQGSSLEGQYLVQRLEGWVATTATGDLGEVRGLRRRGQAALRRIASEARFCQSGACTPENGCFYKLARRRAREAHIVVINHSLLLADLGMQGELLPESAAVVVDEAHHLVDVARDQLSIATGRAALEEALLDLGGLGEPGATDALRRLVRETAPPVRRTEGLGRLRKLEEEVERARRRLLRVFTAADPPAGGSGRRRYRQSEDLPLPLEELEDLLTQLSDVRRRLGEAMSGVEELPGFDAEDERWQRSEAARTALAEQEAALRHLVYPDDGGRVYAYDVAEAGAVTLRSTPLDVGASLRENLFYAKEAVVVTSATLAVDGSVEHTAAQLGLERGDYDAAIYPPPFALDEQVLALGLTGGPGPNTPRFAAAVAGAVARMAAAVPRKMLVLFTSRELLAQVAELLEGRLTGVEILAQARGGGEGARLAQEFRQAPRAILLGTASFWEGVDFPGGDLEILVVTRLPFAVPTDPLEAALSEAIRAGGGDPFRERALPQSILRLRQGFGRLIRRRTDRGAFVVLDPRLQQAGYGAGFRRSLGVSVRPVRTAAEAAGAMRLWFDTGGQQKGGAS
ncbi:MAG: hypothetical protein GF355_00860 [Candidatus Eisenbacteria bacterium]|nr:hypothetical protein [Candidatus Eisenbacteria bacterium]